MLNIKGVGDGLGFAQAGTFGEQPRKFRLIELAAQRIVERWNGRRIRREQVETVLAKPRSRVAEQAG